MTSVNSLPLGVERALRIRETGTSGLQPGAMSRAEDHGSRWKFEGPHLPSMPQAEFDRYLRRIVESPEMRKQFREFLLVVRTQNKRIKEIERLRKEAGFDEKSKEDNDKLDKLCEIGNADEEVDQFMLELRDRNDDLSAELSRLIGEFFDLPPFPKNKILSSGMNLAAALSEEGDPNPPPVHPSAGLSYLKTGAFMENHPIHGPQIDRAPVQARVLRPREASTGQFESAVLGVGGFTARDITAKNFRLTDLESNGNKGRNWDFENPDANKMWINPLYAFVDSVGKIKMRILYPEKEAVAVKTGAADPRPGPLTESDAEFTRKLKSLQGAVKPEGGGSPKPSSGIRTSQRARALDSEEIKRFQEVIKRPNQDLGRTLVETLQARENRRL